MMKKQLLLSLLVAAFCGWSKQTAAQTTTLGIPQSWRIKTGLTEAPVYATPAFDVQEQLRIDELNQTNKVGQWRFGYEFPVQLGLHNSGVWTTLPNGDRVWRIEVYCHRALSINLIFQEFFMPEGAHVQLYSPDRSQQIGAYTARNNSPAAMLGTSILKGERMVVEYYEPAAVQGQGRLTIGTIVHGYKPLRGYTDDATKDLNDSGACNHDVGCPLGNGWDAEISSVALIIDGGGICTGAIVNNTSNDGTPYFLTANHCLGGENSWVFRFNWNSPTFICGANGNSTDPGGPYDEINGCVRRANNGGSDFGLLELNATPDPSWGVIYAGWDRSESPVPQGTGIHHPSGDIKKICRENDALVQTTWSGASVWQITDWDLGVTEPGSSGSPLFDQNHRIIGQLYGGGAACSGTTDNGQDDNYGRFGISWNGSSAATRLKDWLDPSNSNVNTLDGFNPNIPTLANDAGARNIDGIDATMCNVNTITPEVTIKNFGYDALTSVNIYYNLDGGANSVYNWTGNIASLGSAVVTLPTITVPTGGNHTFNAYTDMPNMQQDSNSNNNAASFSFYVTLGGQTLDFNLQLDEYGEEVTWEITDGGGTVVASGGPYSNDFPAPPPLTESLCLAVGCYTFTIYDDWGDGLAGWQDPGDFNITDANGNVLVEMTATDGNYGFSETHNFCVSAPGIPVAQFNASETTICVGNSITFTDASTNSPTAFAWTFDGGSPASSTQASQTVSYATPGSYDVQLIVSNGLGSDTVNQTITVVPNNMAIAGNVTNASSGNNNGGVNITMSGGTAPFVYNWSNGSSSTNIIGLAAGNYTVTVTDANGCTASQSFTVTMLSSIDGIASVNTWNVYPNPTNNYATIEIQLDKTGEAQIELYNATGQMLQTLQSGAANNHLLQLNVTDYAQGMYFVKLNVNGKIEAKKLVVLH